MGKKARVEVEGQTRGNFTSLFFGVKVILHLFLVVVVEKNGRK